MKTQFALVVVALAVTTVVLYRPRHAATRAQSSQAMAVGRHAPVASPVANAVEAIRARLLAWQAETDPLRRQKIQDELVARLTDANAGDIVRALAPDLLNTPFGEIALVRWARVDHRAAAEWMATLPGATQYQAGLVTYGWLAVDRAGLHAYLNSLPDDSPWKQAVTRAATNDALLVKDGPEAIGLLSHLPAEPQRDEMLGWATTEWAKLEPARAATWAQDVADPALQAKLFGAAAIGYAWTDPRAAADLLTQAEIGSSESTALSSVMNIWSRSAPADAAQWACDHLSGESLQLALRSAVLAWGYRDAASADAWVRGLPEGPAKVQAARTLARANAALQGKEQSDLPPKATAGAPRVSTNP